MNFFPKQKFLFAQFLMTFLSALSSAQAGDGMLSRLFAKRTACESTRYNNLGVVCEQHLVVDGEDCLSSCGAYECSTSQSQFASSTTSCFPIDGCSEVVVQIGVASQEAGCEPCSIHNFAFVDPSTITPVAPIADPAPVIQLQSLSQTVNPSDDISPSDRKDAPATQSDSGVLSADATNSSKKTSGSNAADSPVAEIAANEKLEQEKLAEEILAEEKLAAEKAELERQATEKAAQDKIEQEKLAAEKAAAEKLAAEKAEQERLALEKAEQEKLAAEKAAAEKKELERLAAEKAAAEKADQERIAAEKAAAEKAAAEKAALDRAAAQKAAAERQGELVILGISVAKKTSSGDFWDVASGMPDVGGEVTGPNNERVQLTTKPDTTTATYDKPLFAVRAGDKIAVSIVDADFAVSDSVGTATYTITAEDMQAGKLELQFGSVESLQFKIK